MTRAFAPEQSKLGASVVPAEVTTILREDLGVFAREICRLQQGHNGH